MTKHSIAAAVAIAAVSVCHGQVIIDFTNTADSTATAPLASWNDQVASEPFSLATVFYTVGISGMPETVGGFWATNDSPGDKPTRSVSANGGTFRLGWADTSVSGTYVQFRYLVMAKDSNWEGAPSLFTAFDTNSLLTIRAQSQNIDGDQQSVNMVVLDDGTYYISSNRVDANYLTITDPNAQDWQAFDATAWNFDAIDPLAIGGAPHTFNNVQAVGVFLQARDYNGGFLARWALSAWHVEALVVPEPCCAVALLGMAVWIGRRCSAAHGRTVI
jgi:hypothetical protein